MAPRLYDLPPIVRGMKHEKNLFTEQVFITDQTQECQSLRELTSSDFKWNVLANNDPDLILKELSHLKANIGESRILCAICDQGVSTSFTPRTTFSVTVLNKLLETGLYYGSDIYIFTRRNMKQSEDASKNLFTPFSRAGANLAIVTPLLSASRCTPIEATVKVLEYLSTNYIAGDTIKLDDKTVPFTSLNFLRLVHSNSVTIKCTDGEELTITFTSDGFLRITEFFIYKITPDAGIEVFRGSYDDDIGVVEFPDNLYKRPTMTLLAFQNIAFLPSMESQKFSMYKKMLDVILTADLPYNYKLIYLDYDPSLLVQQAIGGTLNRSMNEMKMSAFPIFLNDNSKLKHSEPVLYDGVVMIKRRISNEPDLFRIFQPVSGYVWLCIIVSLLSVAVIFFIIKVINDHQMKVMGQAPEDHDISLFNRFVTVIIRTFSTILLAKIPVESKHLSIRVLYQFYWLASILLVATYAASLAEQRFITLRAKVPFTSLEGLLENTDGYRWFFLRNSSVRWMMEQSEDSVLKGIMSTAKRNWQKDMYVDSVAEAVKRIEDNHQLILIASRMEAEQILSEECHLDRLGPVEHLYPLVYLFSGPDEFCQLVSKRIKMLSADQTFEKFEMKFLSLSNCPLESEQINMRTEPFSIKELGGLFVIVLVGIFISSILAGIEFVVDKYPMYRQWQKANAIKFGEAYTGQVLDVREGGIWIQLTDNKTIAFVDSAHIKNGKDANGNLNLSIGSHVTATYMGNDPLTAKPSFTVS
ncbi:hypothetical protein Aperf_G00000074616 [Anoplocephala perfoliata]